MRLPFRWKPKNRGDGKPRDKKIIQRAAAIEILERRVLLSGTTNSLTFRYDTSRDGADTTETVLTPANVNAATFGKIFTTQTDGEEFASPLYDSNVNITAGPSQGVQNVLYAATENDSLYAINATTGQVLWKDSFINPANNITTLPDADYSDFSIQPQQGITSTPVIDPNTNTLYTLAITKNVISGVDHVQDTLYAINIASGAIVNQTLVSDTIYNTTTGTQTYVSGPWVNGTGAGSISGKLYFDGLIQLQRCALTINGGNVYIDYGSLNDTGPYHGWILGYNETSLAPTAVFNTTPNGSEAGIWEGGAGLAVDSSGNMYFMTGNGAFDTTLNANGFPVLGDYGDSIVKIVADPTTSATNQNINGWGLKVVDYFTPFNQAALDATDGDFGSGGPLLLPASVGSAADPNLIVAVGKEGRLYLINANNMGKFNPNTDNVVQEVNNAVSGLLATPTYYNGSIYLVPAYGGQAVAFSIANGVISSSPTSTSGDSYSFPGDNGTISANGTSAGIFWAVDDSSSTLRAYNATNLSNELWTSAQAGANRDALGYANKFVPPVVANGMVYVGDYNNQIVAYGLLPTPTVAPSAPNQLAASATVPNQVQLTWANTSPVQQGVIIKESTDGLNFTTTVATLTGYPTSYSVTGLQSGTNYYFEVIATNTVGNSSPSNIASATTLAGAQGVILNFNNGFTTASAAQYLTLNGSTAVSNGALVLTNNQVNEAASAFSTSPLDINSFHTDFTFNQNAGTGYGLTFTIQGVGPTALGADAAGEGYQGISKSICVNFALSGGGVTGIYTNGEQPTNQESPIPLTPFNVLLGSGHTMYVAMDYNGTTLNVTISDTVTGASATQSYAINIPAEVGSSSAWVGFTAGTGSPQTATQQINYWNFIPGQASPTNLTAKYVSSTQIALAWNEPANTQTGYLVQQSTDNVNFTTIATASPYARSFVVGNLQPSSAYYFRLIATNPTGNSEPSNTAVNGTLGGAAAAPINFSTGFPSTASSSLSLLGSSKIVNNVLELTDGGTSENAQAYSLTQVDAAAFTTSFNFQMTAPAGDKNPIGEGFTFVLQSDGPTQTGQGQSGMGYCAMPNSVAIKFDTYQNTSEGNDSTYLYTDGANPIYGGTDLTPSGVNLRSGDVMNATLTYNGTTLTVVITDTVTAATATQTYTINIPSVLGSNQAYAGFTASTGTVVAIQNITNWTFTPLPPQPLQLTATPTSATNIALSWVDPATSQTGFTIERSTDGISYSPIGTVGNVTTYNDQNFSGGVLYYYEVIATNAAGSSAPSNIAQTIDPTPPTRPINVVVTLNSPTQINIAWTNTATNATGIMINRKVGANGVLTTVATLPPTATSYNDTNVTPGTLYEYHVQSFNISGNNDFSGVSVTSLPAAPTGVTAIGGNNENTISWQPVTGAVSYNIYRATVSGGETSVALATNLTTTSFSDTGLPLNSTYYYEVTAVDAGGEGPRSSEVHGTTTNVSALQVVSTTPAKGATGVSRSAPITVTFNESVNFVTVSGSTFTLTPTAGGPAVTATVTYTDSNFTATLTPSAILSPNTQYTVTLSSLIQDEFNDPLATYSWTFTTGS